MNNALSPFPFHLQLRDHFKKRERTWKWFSGQEVKEEQNTTHRTALLKNTYRLYPSIEPGPHKAFERFEFAEGTSSKFWEVNVTDNTLTVRYGRIGTKGQQTTKDFADQPAALRQLEKLRDKKVDKGYVKVE